MAKNSFFLAALILCGILVVFALLWKRDSRSNGAPKAISAPERTAAPATSATPAATPDSTPLPSRKTRKAPPLISDDEMDKMMGETLEEMDRRKFEDSLKEPKQIVKLRLGGDVSYFDLARAFDKGDLSAFIECLQDENAPASERRRAAAFVGLVAPRGDRTAIDALLDFAGGSVDWSKWSGKSELRDCAIAKWEALSWVGYVGGEYAEATLLRAMTPAGGEELTKEWLEGVPSTAFRRESVLGYFRGAAARGLAHRSTPEIRAAIVSEYEKELAVLAEKGEMTSAFFSQVVSALAAIDIVAEIGVEGYMRMSFNKSMELYGKYLGKYTDPLRKKKTPDRR